MDNNEPVKRVMLWGVYRSLSSAITRAFRQRDDTRVHFEPFIVSYYLSDERTSMRIEDPKMISKANNYSKQWEKVLAPALHNEKVIFTKDFPMCIPEERW